jgi:hypothetical protein
MSEKKKMFSDSSRDDLIRMAVNLKSENTKLKNKNQLLLLRNKKLEEDITKLQDIKKRFNQVVEVQVALKMKDVYERLITKEGLSTASDEVAESAGDGGWRSD